MSLNLSVHYWKTETLQVIQEEAGRQTGKYWPFETMENNCQCNNHFHYWMMMKCIVYFCLYYWYFWYSLVAVKSGPHSAPLSVRDQVSEWIWREVLKHSFLKLVCDQSQISLKSKIFRLCSKKYQTTFISNIITWKLITFMYPSVKVSAVFKTNK